MVDMIRYVCSICGDKWEKEYGQNVPLEYPELYRVVVHKSCSDKRGDGCC